MTEEEKQRGSELQGYIDSIRDMTIKEIAIKHLKKHHLPKFLSSLLVRFSAPLLLAKDYELRELKKENAELKERNRELLESCEGATMMYKDLCKAKEIIRMVIDSYNHKERFSFEKDLMKAEQFLNSEVEK